MPSVWNSEILGIVGGGNMAEALVRGVIAADLIPALRIVVYDPLVTRREVFRGFGCVVAENAHEVLNSDVILLATKPQNLPDAVRTMTFSPGKPQLLISIAAGISTRVIERLLPTGSRVIRVMPNTPLLVGMGVSALARGTNANEHDLTMALELFSCCGKAVEVDEKLMDGVTALSGSGPAYLFRFAEVLMNGGIAIGLPPELSKELTIALLRGSAEMLSRYQDAAVLRERVTSPGGTTAAALKVFDERNFGGMVAAALEAARYRSQELGREQ